MKHKHADLIHANIHRFRYESGVLRWVDGPRQGKIAGWQDSHGYIQIKLKGCCVLAHRIIWLMFNKSYPEQIDHINRVRTDNRIENLRSATHTQNQHNASKRKDNSSGFIGVNKHYKKYQARISVNGKRKNLGVFSTIEEASKAYQQAKEKYHVYTS